MHTQSMDKVTGISVLRQALALPEVSRSSVGRALGIDASQVSRIAAGRFVKLEGHALRVCKYAQGLIAGSNPAGLEPQLASDSRLLELAAANPQAAKAVSDLIDALLAAGPAPLPAAGSHGRLA